MEQIIIKRLSIGTIFKLNLVGLFFGLMPLMILFGILGVLGMETVSWNDEPVIGPMALIAGPGMGVFIALLFTLFLTPFMWLGQWI